ncbi:hypothetical protein NQD34_005678 [Periophthalmus magnuspinnatus]|nr:hypothetical protein NQD34_005678 [Periophthalmus magnuspinnatus]
MNFQSARSTGGGGGVAVISHSSLILSPKPNYTYLSFESLALSITCPNWKNQKAVIFIIIYRPPGPYADFLTEFSDFISSLVLNWERIVIVGDFNIHVDNGSDCLSNAFGALLDGIGFTQSVNKPTHCHNHTLDLVLTYGIEINDLIVLPQNPILSDHFLITFHFILKDYPAPQKKTIMKRTLSDKSVTEFKEIIEPLLKDMSCDNDNNFNPIVTDQLVDRTMLTLKSALDVVAPLKQKSIKPRPPAPWYTLQLRTLKQHVRRQRSFRRHAL